MQRDIKKMTTIIKNRTGKKSAFLGDVDPCPIMLTAVPNNTRKEKEHKRKLMIKHTSRLGVPNRGDRGGSRQCNRIMKVLCLIKQVNNNHASGSPLKRGFLACFFFSLSIWKNCLASQ